MSELAPDRRVQIKARAYYLGHTRQTESSAEVLKRLGISYG
ncbi:MAG: hypothetical protein UU47_C0014G0013 [candidate division TM6 bacterium GW2011_GWE2_41_16]|nr:MAG: hypothetical protein UU47_C0014G0013 [candidate division TM6 bacterium GW2011_GWE2_41_16]